MWNTISLVVKRVATRAEGLGFHSPAGDVVLTIANGSPSLRCFFGAVLFRRKTAKMGPATRNALRRNTATLTLEFALFRNRSMPCRQAKYDQYRIFYYDLALAKAGTKRVAPLLLDRHNAVPGMALVSANCTLLQEWQRFPKRGPKLYLPRSFSWSKFYLFVSKKFCAESTVKQFLVH